MASIQNVKEPEAYERTIVVSNVPMGNFSDKIMVDILRGYFQKADNTYGEVENITYPTRIKGVAFVTYKKLKDVETILKKKRHYLTEKGLPSTCLVVSHFSENVIRYISVHLDLSIFGKEAVLENLVKELKEKIPSLKFDPVQTNREVIVQGSFLAIKKLKDILLLRATSLQGNNTNGVSLEKRKKKKTYPECGASVSSVQSAMPNITRNEQIVVLDTDVFKYMKSKQIYEKTLENFNVVSKEIVNDEVTTIYLRDSQKDSHSDHLKKVKKLIEEFSYSLSFELRKETLCFDGKDMKEVKQILFACQLLEPNYPQLLVEYYSKHINIIGNSNDTYQFKELVMKSVEKKKSSESTMTLAKMS